MEDINYDLRFWDNYVDEILRVNKNQNRGSSTEEWYNGSIYDSLVSGNMEM